ncbi:MAG: NAD-dependent malic enzyme [Chlamydiota bacterium]
MKKHEHLFKGEYILNNPLLNKGSAFTQKERDALALNGHLPYSPSTIEKQLERRYQNFRSQPNDLAKHVFLSSLQNRNETLFYRLVLEHINEMLPLIYTPTVGEASKEYSYLYQEPRGLYLSYPLKDRMDEMVGNVEHDEIDVIVVTDGERILGLGDLGVGGMAIPVGKLALYTLFGGTHPARVLPVHLDVGTNNKELLDDPLYLGWRHERIRGKEYDDFVDSFVKTIKKRYPNVLLQWEDFAGMHARPLLERYRDQICSFNDDIQGTAAVALSAILSAVHISQEKLQNQKIVILGAGAAGMGICNELLRALINEGMSETQAVKNFYLVDIQGLVHTGLEKVEEHHKKFARDAQEVTSWRVDNPPFISLLDTVRAVHPTILIGVSTQTGAFTEEIITTMATQVKRPVIFPLSNPTSRCEANPHDLIRWTKGKAIIATGSPFDPVLYDNHLIYIAQCNNVYIFPGVGLGTIASKAKKVSDKMFLAAAKVLSEHSPMLQDPNAMLFPSFEHLRPICRTIAIAVGLMAQQENLAPKTSLKELEESIDTAIWFPSYN